MTNTVSAKERNLDPDMDAIIERMMNVTKRHLQRIKNILFYWPHVQLRVFRKRLRMSQQQL